jgi:hypothetical protein
MRTPYRMQGFSRVSHCTNCERGILIGIFIGFRNALKVHCTEFLKLTIFWYKKIGARFVVLKYTNTAFELF